MNRRALIEFMGPGRIKITTSLFQKEFDLGKLSKERLIIDLVSLKMIKEGWEKENTIFKTKIDEGNGTLGNPYVLSIIAKTSKDEFNNLIGTVSIKDKNKIFTVNFPD